MKTSIQGIINALEILVDYPGIEETVDIKKSQQFLKYLEKSGISEIPETNEKISLIIDSQKTTLNDWRKALSAIKFHPNNCSYEFEEGTLIDGLFYLITYDDDGDIEFANDPSGSFKFSRQNTAEVRFWIKYDGFESKTGTWSEIFEILSNFSEKYFSVPEIPNT